MIWQKINYIHANPVKAGLVKSAKDYPWSSFRSFYSQDDQSLAVDHDWSWPDDVEKLSQAIKQMGCIGEWFIKPAGASHPSRPKRLLS
jgi:hypothetical protein